LTGDLYREVISILGFTVDLTDDVTFVVSHISRVVFSLSFVFV